MSEKRSWQWNYFTEISMHYSICDICDTILKTILRLESDMKNHLDAEHDGIYTKNIKSSNLDIFYFYDIPKRTATCKECSFLFYPITHGISTQMTKHLSHSHGVHKSNWTDLQEWIFRQKNCRQDCVTKFEVMTILRCQTCKSSNPLSHNNGISWVKHLIQHGLENLPLEIAPVQELVNRFRNSSFPKNVENVSLTGHPTPPSDSNVLSGNPDYNPLSACKKFIGLSFAKYKSAAVQSSFKTSTSSGLVHHDSEESKTTEANKECNKCADNNPLNVDIEKMINRIVDECNDSVPLEYQEQDKDTLPSNYQQVLDDLDLFFKTLRIIRTFPNLQIFLKYLIRISLLHQRAPAVKNVPVNEENSILSLLKKMISDTATSSNTARSLQQPNAMSRSDSDNSSVIQVLDVLLLFSYLCRSFY